MKNIAILIFTIILSNVCFAQNPIISQSYNADPAGLEYDGRLYIWMSHDNEGQIDWVIDRNNCISTTDLRNWTDHGTVFKGTEDIAWAPRVWAPSVVERNGTFYLYTGNKNDEINVATSDNPLGPFKGVGGKPIITRAIENADVEWCFDPAVYIEDDGQAYCVFGGGKELEGRNARIIKLGSDLISTEGPAIFIDAPSDFFEGGWIHARTVNDVKKYYFSYFSWKGTGATIDYMMSDDLLTGWEYKGTILPQLPYNVGNSHAAIFPYKDKWYIAYHNRKVHFDRVDEGLETYSRKQRSVCIDELQYNDDYTIKQVVPTDEGPQQLEALNPFVRNEAETMAEQSYLLPGIKTEVCADEDGGRMVTDIDNGDWIKIAGVDFEEGANTFVSQNSST